RHRRRRAPPLGAVGPRPLRDRLQPGRGPPRRRARRHPRDDRVRRQRGARRPGRLHVRGALRQRRRGRRPGLRVRRRHRCRDRRRERLRRLRQRARRDARRPARGHDQQRLHAPAHLRVLEDLLRGYGDRRRRHGRRPLQAAAAAGAPPSAARRDDRGAPERDDVNVAARVALRLVARWEALLVALIVGGGVWSWTLSDFFLRWANLLDLATPYVFIGLLALGLTFVVVAGEIDISVASTMAVSAVCCAQVWQAGVHVWLAAVVGLAVATALGLVNGVLVGVLGPPSLAVTLGTLAAFRGLAYVILGGGSVAGQP